MTRDRAVYLLKDLTGAVQARMVLDAEETPVLEPWMVQNIRHRGWSVEKWQARPSGVQVHGRADWQAVAERMAAVLRQVVEEEVTDDDSAEKMLADARAALDEFTLAELEMAVAAPDPVEGEGGEDGRTPGS